MELIKKSVGLVNKNMLMIVPFLFQFIIVGGIVFVSILIGSLWIFSSGGTGEEFYGFDQLLTQMGVAYPILISIGLFLVGISLLIQSFVMSGVVGMAKEALESGRTSLADFFKYGKKYFIKVLLIELMGSILSILVMLPMFLYLLGNIDAFLVSERLPLEFFVIYLISGFVAAIVYFVAHFSMIPLIKGEVGVWEAIRSSFLILPKGFKDCMILLGISLIVIVLFIAVAIALAFIPILGQILVSIIQFYFVVVLLAWSLMFYDKYKLHNEEFEIEK